MNVLCGAPGVAPRASASAQQALKVRASALSWGVGFSLGGAPATLLPADIGWKRTVSAQLPWPGSVWLLQPSDATTDKSGVASFSHLGTQALGYLVRATTRDGCWIPR